MDRSPADPATHRSSDTADGGREASAAWSMVGGGLLLGTIGVFVEEAGQHPLTAVWFRCAFGALALLAWAAASGRLNRLRMPPAGSVAALATGVLMLANWALFFGAIERTSIAVATVVFHVQPFWVLLLGALWLREPVSRAQALAVAAALAGLVLATGLLESGAASRALDARYLAGLAMCLGGSLCYALVTLIARRHGGGGLSLAWTQCVVGTMLLVWWPVSQGWPAPGAAWGWLAGLGVLHTGLAYVLLYGAMARLPAGRIAVLLFVYPAAAIVVDALVYGRVLTTWQMVGVGVMAAALLGVRRAARGQGTGPASQP